MQFLDWATAPKANEKDENWQAAWQDAEWDDEDPDDSFQQKLRDEIKKALERVKAAQKAK